MTHRGRHTPHRHRHINTHTHNAYIHTTAYSYPYREADSPKVFDSIITLAAQVDPIACDVRYDPCAVIRALHQQAPLCIGRLWPRLCVRVHAFSAPKHATSKGGRALANGSLSGQA